MTHWYRKDGSSCHELPKKTSKTGEMRDVTLRDARTMNLFPSVTGILQVLDAPGLTKWKVDQAIKAVMRLMPDKSPSEPDESFIKRALYESQTIAREARNKGQELHDACQHWMDGSLHRVPGEYTEHCQGVEQTLREAFGSGVNAAWITEESFACKEGYGGRCDLGSRALHVIIDFKTKDFGPDKLPEIYDEHTMQMPAYRNGLDYPEDSALGNLFISTTHPGLTHLVMHAPEEIAKGWELFKIALQLWHLRNGYRPEW